MVDKQSYTIDRERWSRLSVFEQLGNIGSEVGRTLKMMRKGRDYEPALTRALDLFEATVTQMLKTHPHRAKEVLRAKECFLDAVFIKDDPGIEAYFTQFAIAARNQQVELEK